MLPHKTDQFCEDGKGNPLSATVRMNSHIVDVALSADHMGTHIAHRLPRLILRGEKESCAAFKLRRQPGARPRMDKTEPLQLRERVEVALLHRDNRHAAASLRGRVAAR